MEAGTILCEPFFRWLVQTSLQASFLVVVILLLQKVLGDRISVRGRYCLWLVLLIRMAMPWAPPSRVSLYNLLPASLTDQSGLAKSPVVPEDAGLTAAGAGRSIERWGAGAFREVEQNPIGDGKPKKNLGPVGWMVRGLSLLWLLGTCALAGYVLACGVRLRRIVRDGQHVTSRETLDVLNACRGLMGTRAKVDVIATDRLGSPALFGLFRPRLLLPGRTLAEATPLELRHIILHELAHLKRRDILVAHLAGALHVLHWFNPLIAWGMRQMRIDRELACDAMALSLLEPEETTAYGRTVVAEIERLLASPCRPALINLCSVRTRVKQRIAMIARFRKEAYCWSALPLLLVATVTCVGLTERPTEYIDWDHYARGDFPTTHQDQHPNINRCCLRNTWTGQYLVVDGRKVTCADEPGEAGLWEFRFDELTNTHQDITYFYSVAARKYLTSDENGNLSVSAAEPDEGTHWGPWSPGGTPGVWLISHCCQNGYLRVNERGHVGAEPMNRDHRSYWDVHRVWRVKTSDNPKSNPEWQRDHIPGPD